MIATGGRDRHELKADLKWGVSVMLALMALAAVVAAIQYATKGPLPFERLGTSIGQVLLIYAIAGSVAGLALGLLRPISGTKPGGAFFGFIVAFCGYGAIGLARGSSAPLSDILLISVVVAILMGVPLGIWYAGRSRI